MNVLVTAASKHGSTAEIAEAIGRVLARQGHVASVLAPDEVILVMSTVIEGLKIRSAVVPGLVADDLIARALMSLMAATIGPDVDGPREQLDQVRLGPVGGDETRG